MCYSVARNNARCTLSMPSIQTRRMFLAPRFALSPLRIVATTPTESASMNRQSAFQITPAPRNVLNKCNCARAASSGVAYVTEYAPNDCERNAVSLPIDEYNPSTIRQIAPFTSAAGAAVTYTTRTLPHRGIHCHVEITSRSESASRTTRPFCVPLYVTIPNRASNRYLVESIASPNVLSSLIGVIDVTDDTGNSRNDNSPESV